MRILVIRRDNIGDLVCTTPLIAGLRKRYPDAHIAALVNSYNAAVLEGSPDLDAVHVYTKLKHRLPGQSRLAILWRRFRMLAALRREPFDYVVLAGGGFNRHALGLARQLRRRHVVGFAGGHERGARHVTVRVPPGPYPELHEVQLLGLLGRAMDAADAEGPLRVLASPARVAEWRKRVPDLDDHTRPWVAVHISAREPERRWAAERWSELIERLAAQGCGVLVVWAPGAADDPRHPGDDDKAARILAALSDGMPVRGAPTPTLEDLIAVLACCDAFVGADGGAMHLAAGLGLPMVALFENLDSKRKRWHPWRVPHELVAPATRDVGDISVPQVAEAWRRLSRSTALPARTPAPTT